MLVAADYSFRPGVDERRQADTVRLRGGSNECGAITKPRPKPARS